MKTPFIRHISVLFIMIFTVLFCFSCNQKNENGKIIITQLPEADNLPDPSTGDSWRFVKGSVLALVDPDEPSSSEVLTKDFFSACSPEVSWDGKILLFAGQKSEYDLWQIWKMDLDSRNISRITDENANCIDPVSLPNGKIVFSKTEGFGEQSSYPLFVCNSDGSEQKQITFIPHSNLATSILRDGRLIAVTRQLLPIRQDPMLIVLRPDGTKADLFYGPEPGSLFAGRVRETEDGRIFFIINDSTGYHHSDIMSVDYNRPLFTARKYSERLSGSIASLFPIEPDKLLISYRSKEEGTYGLYEFDTKTGQAGKKVFAANGMNIIDAVLIKEQIRPKKLPSEVDPGVKTGLLMCQDINFTGLGIESDYSISQQIEIVGLDSSMGVVQVDPDGSFYLKIIADKPFRIRKLDNKNQPISESAWLWLRPNERRGCVGCHEHPELAPVNRVPQAIKKDPVNIPVHVSKISEKEVELE